MSHIRPESSVSLYILAAAAVAVFTLFTTFEPSFHQIEVNASEIKNLKDIQRDYLKHMISVQSSLSRIEGRLDATISRDR